MDDQAEKLDTLDGVRSRHSHTLDPAAGLLAVHEVVDPGVPVVRQPAGDGVLSERPERELRNGRDCSSFHRSSSTGASSSRCDGTLDGSSFSIIVTPVCCSVRGCQGHRHMPNEYRLRPATSEDALFLIDMLVEAVNWAPRRQIPRQGVLSDPRLARYVEGWPHPTDQGVVALAGGETIGAVWLRLFLPDEPGFGFIADDIPELSMAVLPAWRGRGIGRALLQEQVRQATASGVRRISLSVERANFAARLYTSEGFQVIAQDGDEDYTMLKDLACG